MKLFLQTRSFINEKKTKRLYEQQRQNNKIQINTKQSLGTKQQTNNQKIYFNVFPEQKRKPIVSVFNFLSHKSNTKISQSKGEITHRSKVQSVNLEGNFLIMKRKQPFPSLSAQRISIVHLNQDSRFEKQYLDKSKIEEQELDLHGSNKSTASRLKQILNKNTKFDRKKYMYYRYRKKLSPKKTDLKDKQTIQKEPSSYANFSKRSLKKLSNYQIDVEKNTFTNYQNPQKIYLCGALTTKNRSFSSIKQKLTVEPTPRRQSYKLIDRQGLCKTTRDTNRYRIQLAKHQKNGTKIFSEAIHFKKNRFEKCKTPQFQIKKQNKTGQKTQEALLGWNQFQQPQLDLLIF